MNGKIFLLTLIFSISFSIHAFAQWPRNFYVFKLKDATGNIIRPANTEYKMIVIPDSATDVVLGIKICNDDTIWRFYEGGNHYMGSTQKLKIVKNVNGKISENMIIEFPPSFSKGKEQYYRNLYAGELNFKKVQLQLNFRKPVCSGIT
jgi:hypothetical protein